MKTPEDEAFDDLARRQGAWGGGFNAKRQAAMDKVNAEFTEEYIKYRTAFPKGYIAPQQEPVQHWSDCAVHNGPAYPAGPCDCGVAQEPPKYAISAYWEEDGRIGVVATVVRPDGGVHLLNAIIDPPQPTQEPDALTIAYQSGYHDGKKAALATREWNFCERCGKRTRDVFTIHTCTPPQGAA
jgi:hypothetical protein